MYNVPVAEGLPTPGYWQAQNVPFLNEMQQVNYIVHTITGIDEQVFFTRRGEAKSGIEKAYNFLCKPPLFLFLNS